MDFKLIILIIVAGVLLILSLTYFLIKYYKEVNADDIKVELDDEIVKLKAPEENGKQEEEKEEQPENKEE